MSENLDKLKSLTSARQEHPGNEILERLQIKLKNESQLINIIFKTSVAFKASENIGKNYENVVVCACYRN